MPLKLFRRNQEPEPVRAWFARLFHRPTPAVDELTRKPVRVRIPALESDPVARLVRDLQAARDEAARWKRYAETYDTERTEAGQLCDQYRNELERAEKERDGAYRERAQLLAWLAALHPSTTVITQSPDVDEDGWQLLYLVAGGWQLSWHIHPRDAELFRHVTVVDVTDPRAQWDGHGSEQKYERIHNHVRLLALDELGGDGPSTGVTTEVRSA
ncbi:hypothetical protein F3K39_19035 [Streptomyces sp. LBUM 1479]|uniref:hypothetical protein n=1 Tax=Streptomyces scabiei TaxID=1930 RepID=UPI001B30250B|nr:hypothetical protein [Streptomyces sp. LBUM 1475]MBP5930164.1 hypothetical protein [Streptomyces sp. LBUM 1479]QTU63151.1 hypothetical protein F3K22_20915 [Streptomyces sp. LBUM 1475]